QSEQARAPFEVQQPLLALQAAAVAGEAAGGADDPVAGDDDAAGVAAVGEADGAGRLGAAEGVGEPSVGTGLAVGDARQRVPDAALERGAVRAQREGELLDRKST